MYNPSQTHFNTFSVHQIKSRAMISLCRHVTYLHLVWVWCELDLSQISWVFHKESQNLYKCYNFKISIFWYSGWAGWYVDLFQIGRRSFTMEAKAIHGVVRLPPDYYRSGFPFHAKQIENNITLVSAWKQVQTSLAERRTLSQMSWFLLKSSLYPIYHDFHQNILNQKIFLIPDLIQI